MAYKLITADVVDVPVKFSVQDGPRTRQFAFTLIAKRLGKDELKETVDSNRPVPEFLAEVITDWRGQTLLVDDADGKPAPYSTEALEAMLALPFLEGVIFTAYLEACGAKGRRGN